ncbi:MAG: MarR family winged helix-turn-helix transcriptional regulator, partial [Gallintestinimicrobium sp.]
EKNGTSVKVSDISDALNLPRPGVTRTVKEMEKKGYLTKKPSEEDARILYLSITGEGKKLSAKYNEQVFNALLPELETISDEDAECTIRTIEIFYQVMCERRNDLDK